MGNQEDHNNFHNNLWEILGIEYNIKVNSESNDQFIEEGK